VQFLEHNMQYILEKQINVFFLLNSNLGSFQQYTSFSHSYQTRYQYLYQIIVLIEGQEIYSDLYLKKIGKIYLVMAQTFDLYANLYET
jgi:hypothetical protein